MNAAGKFAVPAVLVALATGVGYQENKGSAKVDAEYHSNPPAAAVDNTNEELVNVLKALERHHKMIDARFDIQERVLGEIKTSIQPPSAENKVVGSTGVSVNQPVAKPAMTRKRGVVFYARGTNDPTSRVFPEMMSFGKPWSITTGTDSDIQAVEYGTQEFDELSDTYGVNELPTWILLDGGIVVRRHVGMLDSRQAGRFFNGNEYKQFKSTQVSTRVSAPVVESAPRYETVSYDGGYSWVQRDTLTGMTYSTAPKVTAAYRTSYFMGIPIATRRTYCVNGQCFQY